MNVCLRTCCHDKPSMLDLSSQHILKQTFTYNIKFINGSYKAIKWFTDTLEGKNCICRPSDLSTILIRTCREHESTSPSKTSCS